MTKELIKELIKESVNESDNKSVNKSTTNWYDKNKFNKILTTIDSNNKIGKFKFNDINNLIDNIKSNTISEANTKKKIN